MSKVINCTLYILLLTTSLGDSKASTVDQFLLDTPEYTYFPPQARTQAAPLDSEAFIDLSSVRGKLTGGQTLKDVLDKLVFTSKGNEGNVGCLILEDNAINDSDIVDIGSTIMNFKRLNSLRLDHNQISSNGLGILLLKAFDHPSLEHIYIRDNKISGSEKDKNILSLFDLPKDTQKKVTVYGGELQAFKANKQLLFK